MEQQTIPVLFTDNLFVFPGCNQIFNLAQNEYARKIFIASLRVSDGQILIVSSRKAVSQRELDAYEPLKFFNYGSLIKIKLDLQSSADIEAVFNYLSEVQLLGLERVRIVSIEENSTSKV